MRYRITFAAGLAVGYVLGSKAGRERYEQIKRTAQRVADNPSVQEAAGLVGAQASRVASLAKAKVGDAAGRLPFLRQEEYEKDTGTGWPYEEQEPTRHTPTHH
ncbi:hypothetical protein SAMN05421505_102229 [Sinosporangium album]|uniref:Uncharacterized protein n=1 Tax=Sinosporangium album TaxID=504805 RepID=A0A1G7SAA4_9ACTN|nr:YtxH domain-containing protein [Sinosporangium album]SDG19985.1 hypothetical protein SAMN05421505_102229 [Sinosporangium album]